MRIISKNLLASTLLGFLLATVCADQLAAQSTPKKAPAKSAAVTVDPATTAPAKKQTAGPFHGRLKAIDRTAGTIAMGTRTFHVTGSTKITKDGKPATLAEGAVGEMVSGYFKTSEDGKLTLSTLRFGPKPEGEAKSSAARPGK
jgi:hypothetical protein